MLCFIYYVVYLLCCLLIEIEQVRTGRSTIFDCAARDLLNPDDPEKKKPEQCDVWQTYLLKVYYYAVQWMNRYRFKQMQNCRIDSDWEHVNIGFRSFLSILNKSMKETIKEKRIRWTGNDKRIDIKIILKQMIIAVSELFCILEQHALKFNNSPLPAKKAHKDLYINFKNHYYPKSIYKSSEFIWFVYESAECIFSSQSWTFQNELLAVNAPKSITTYDENTQHNYDDRKLESYKVVTSDYDHDDSWIYNPKNKK